MSRFRWALLGLFLIPLPACLGRGQIRPPVEDPQPTPTHPAPRVNTPSKSPYSALSPLPTPAQPGSLPNRFPPPAPGQVTPRPVPRISIPRIEPVGPPTFPGSPAPGVVSIRAEEEPALVQALRAYMERRPDEAIGHLQKLSTTNQELLLRLLPAVAQLSEEDIARADPQDLALLIDQFHEASEIIRPRAALQTGTICFCHGIDKFGVYVPHRKNYSFQPGQRAELYIELRNFANEPVVSSSESTPDAPPNSYANYFQGELQIRDRRDRTVWRDDWELVEFTRTPRQDGHLVLEFTIDDRITPGEYHLRFKIVDGPTGRSVWRTIDFRVTSRRSGQ